MNPGSAIQPKFSNNALISEGSFGNARLYKVYMPVVEPFRFRLVVLGLFGGA
jgi:hypothetical protein